MTEGRFPPDIGIVAHTSRIQEANQLATIVGAAMVNVDDGTLGCEGNHRRTWTDLVTTGRAEWIVVLEDDAVVPELGFGGQLDGVLRNAPAPIVSLYLGTSRPPQHQAWAARVTALASSRDSCYIPANRLLHGVGVAIRRSIIADVLARLPVDLPIDEAITRAARGAWRIAYCWPSIVDHHDGPTVAAHRDGRLRTQPRKAWCYGTRPCWRPLVILRGNACDVQGHGYVVGLAQAAGRSTRA